MFLDSVCFQYYPAMAHETYCTNPPIPDCWSWRRDHRLRSIWIVDPVRRAAAAVGQPHKPPRRWPCQLCREQAMDLRAWSIVGNCRAVHPLLGHMGRRLCNVRGAGVVLQPTNGIGTVHCQDMRRGDCLQRCVSCPSVLDLPEPTPARVTPRCRPHCHSSPP